MVQLSPDPLVAAVVRLDDKRRELGNELTAAEGINTALSTELDATRAELATRTTDLATTSGQLDKCKATRAWLNDRVAQLEAAWPTGTPLPAAPTPKP